jgi:gentisate 1,2-dioxygenase
MKSMATSALDSKPQVSAKRQEYYQRLNRENAAPLWEVLADIVTPEPKSACVPALWRYDDMRPLLMEAGELITAKEAERRVLVLENPGIRGMSQVTGSLYAGLQLVLPGETAPTHRHTASALRFVLESAGGYTAINGERTTMRPGDFIVTAPWNYHDHGNTTGSPIVWLDVLDIPIVNQLCCSFAEHHDQETQPLTRPEGDSLQRYGSNMAPLEYTPRGLDSPVFTYPYSTSRETLSRMQGTTALHPCHGVKMQYVNPMTGGYAMTTIATFLQLLPAGFSGQPYRSTDATVYCVAEGHGETKIGDKVFSWGPRDVFVAPSWNWISHKAEDEAVLFSASDRPVQKMLHMWREQTR